MVMFLRLDGKTDGLSSALAANALPQGLAKMKESSRANFRTISCTVFRVWSVVLMSMIEYGRSPFDSFGVPEILNYLSYLNLRPNVSIGVLSLSQNSLL